MNFYAFNIGDYAGATRHLTWDEDMAYRRMLDAYYSREEPLPADIRQIYRLVAASEEKHREAVNIILQEFFELHDDGYHNARADEEIVKVSIKKSKARQSASMRWQNDAHSDRNATASKTYANAEPPHAEDMQTQCEGNAPNPNPNPIKEERERARAEEPPHWARVEKILDLNLDRLDDWQREFLQSIRHKSKLTKAQGENLTAIEAVIAAKTAAPPSPATPPQQSVWVWAGTPQWVAWAKVRKWPMKDARHPEGGYRPGWYFTSEWPPAPAATPKVQSATHSGADPSEKAA
jgi:uncharacterized protein YdaU (DUF1376 family)